MNTKTRKIFPLHTTYYILPTILLPAILFFLAGCATSSGGRSYARESLRVNGCKYICLSSLSRTYNFDYQLDPVTKRITLAGRSKEVRMLKDSAVVLLNNQARTMQRELRFFYAKPYIPENFAEQVLVPFLKEEGYLKERVFPKDAALPVKKIIIDAGHGGKDPGAIGKSGLMEKDVVLDIAKRLRKQLADYGIEVVMTRETDRFVSLAERSKIANANAREADFFVSIHANAARSRWVSGVEVFYLSEAIDDNSRSLKAASNYDLELQEPHSGKDTAAILWDLIYTQDRKSSYELAGRILHVLSKTLSQKSRGTKPARFCVLKETNIPAVLVEVGFISNVGEEKRLKSAAYREQIARGLTEGILQHNRTFAQKQALFP